LVQSRKVEEPSGEALEPREAPVPEAGRRRRDPIHPNTVIALKVFLAVLALGLPLTWLASLDTPGLSDRSVTVNRPEPPGVTTGLGMGDFDAQRAAAIARVEALVRETRYREALSAAAEHPELADDEELRQLRALAQSELDRQREEEILEELKRIPVAEYKANLDKYAELVELNPDQSEYRKKFEFYRQKYREQQAASDDSP
jgi:hypothetical protein